MNSVDLPLFVAASIVLAAIIAGLMVVVGVTRLARRPGVLSDGSGDVAGADRIARVDRWTASIVAIWVAGALLGTFVLGNRSSLTALLYVAALVGIGYGLTVFTETGRRLLKAVPQTWLIGAQTFRIVGGVFLIAATYDAVPAYFAIPAGWGDLLTGVAALLVAIWWARRAPFARRAAWAWNIFGLLDLLVALGIGTAVLAAPAATLFGGSPQWLEQAAQGFQPFGPAIFPVSFPLALVPTFIVPLSIVLHLLSLRKLATEGAWVGDAAGSEKEITSSSGLNSQTA